MNKQKWDALPEDLQATLEQTVRDFAQHQVKTLSEADEKAVAQAKEGGEITVHNWSDEERAKFRSIATGEWEKLADRSDNARKVYDTLTGYLKEKGLIQ